MPDVTLILRDTTAAEDLVTEAIDSGQTSLIASRTMALKAQAQLNHGGLGAAGRGNHSHIVTRDAVTVFTISAEPAFTGRTLRVYDDGELVSTEVFGAGESNRAAYAARRQALVNNQILNPLWTFTDLAA